MSRPGRLVDPEGHRTRAQSPPGDLVNPVVPWTCARVAQDSWSNTRAIGAGRESSGTAGRPCKPLEPSPNHPGVLLDPTGPHIRTRVPGRADRARRTRDTGPGRPGEKVDCADIWTLARVKRDSWSTIGPSESSLRPPGQLVKPTGPRIRARDAREGWSNPRDLGLGPESPGTDGRPGQPSDTGLSRP